MYAQVMNGSAMSAGPTPQTTWYAQQNRLAGRFLNQRQNFDFRTDQPSDQTPLTNPLYSSTSKLLYIRNIHNQIRQTPMGMMMGLKRTLPMNAAQVPMIPGGFVGNNQLSDLAGAIPQYSSINEARFVTEDARELALQILNGFNLHGLIPGAEISPEQSHAVSNMSNIAAANYPGSDFGVSQVNSSSSESSFPPSYYFPSEVVSRGASNLLPSDFSLSHNSAASRLGRSEREIADHISLNEGHLSGVVNSHKSVHGLSETRMEKLDFLDSESTVIRRRDEEEDVVPSSRAPDLSRSKEERKVPGWRQENWRGLIDLMDDRGKVFSVKPDSLSMYGNERARYIKAVRERKVELPLMAAEESKIESKPLIEPIVSDSIPKIAKGVPSSIAIEEEKAIPPTSVLADESFRASTNPADRSFFKPFVPVRAKEEEKKMSYDEMRKMEMRPFGGITTTTKEEVKKSKEDSEREQYIKDIVSNAVITMRGYLGKEGVYKNDYLRDFYWQEGRNTFVLPIFPEENDKAAETLKIGDVIYHKGMSVSGDGVKAYYYTPDRKKYRITESELWKAIDEEMKNPVFPEVESGTASVASYKSPGRIIIAPNLEDAEAAKRFNMSNSSILQKLSDSSISGKSGGTVLGKRSSPSILDESSFSIKRLSERRGSMAESSVMRKVSDLGSFVASEKKEDPLLFSKGTHNTDYYFRRK